MEEKVVWVEKSFKSDDWSSLEVTRGCIIEISLGDSNFKPELAIWAGFLVEQVSVVPPDSELVLLCKFIGCSDAGASKELSSMFNRRQGSIHLCSTTPCTTSGDYQVHATKLRIYKEGEFDPPYHTSGTKRQLNRWLEAFAAPVEEGNPDEQPEMLGPFLKRPSSKVIGRSGPSKREKKEEKDKKEKKKKKKKEKEKEKKQKKPHRDESEDMDVERRSTLRAKLDQIRARLTGVKEKKDNTEEDDKDLTEVLSSTSGSSSFAPDDFLQTGTALAVVPSTKGRRAVPGSRKEVEDLQALRDTPTRGFQGQLARRAVAAANVEKGKKTKRKKTPAQQLGEALAKILTPDDGKKPPKKPSREDRASRRKKKKKKERKIRKRGRPGDDPSSSDGSSDSDDGSSNSSGDEDESKESLDYEAPMRRRTREKPGSVLELLVQHAKEQLDQSSTVEVPSSGTRLDSGVKILSYFQILVKPQLGATTAAVREMYHLAAMMDLLRKGHLSQVGDSMAARFFALHQSILDGGWGAAKHLEIHSLEEASATSTAVLLQTRKHAKMALKAQGWEAPSQWNRKGRGRGGKGNGKWQEEWKEWKGNPKGGKKGKGKGKQNQWGDGYGDGGKKGQDWNASKEVPPDK